MMIIFYCLFMFLQINNYFVTGFREDEPSLVAAMRVEFARVVRVAATHQRIHVLHMPISPVGRSPRIGVPSDRRYSQHCRRKWRRRRGQRIARRGGVWFRGFVVSARRLVALKNARAVRDVWCNHVFELYSACRRKWRVSDEMRVWRAREH